MVPDEEKIIKLAKSTVFVLIMLSLSSFFEPEAVFILLLSLIYLKFKCQLMYRSKWVFQQILPLFELGLK